MVRVRIFAVDSFVDIDERGRFYKLKRVRFKFDEREDWIDIPEREYSTEEAFKRVAEAVKTDAELLGLPEPYKIEFIDEKGNVIKVIEFKKE